METLAALLDDDNDYNISKTKTNLWVNSDAGSISKVHYSHVKSTKKKSISNEQTFVPFCHLFFEDFVP